jgi:hypothetical protein
MTDDTVDDRVIDASAIDNNDVDVDVIAAVSGPCSGSDSGPELKFAIRRAGSKSARVSPG